MSVVFINCTGDTFTPTESGAVSICVWETCRAAQKQGIEPTVISRSHAAKPYDWPKTLLVDYPSIRTRRPFGRLLTLQRNWGGWIHLRQKAYALRVVRAIKAAGLENRPFVLNGDPEFAAFLRRCFPQAFILHLFHCNQQTQRKMRKQFVQGTNVIAAVSDYTARWTETHHGMTPGSVKTIYNGVDRERFHPASASAEDIATINFVGRFNPVKGPDLLLRAAQQLARKTKAFRLQLIGARAGTALEPDDYVNSLGERLNELERGGIMVRAPGWIGREALPAELRKAHINVVPSRFEEACNLAILEGMATGLATVASNIGGIPEEVGDAGFLFEPDSVDELADHLEHLVHSFPLRRDYGQKARKRAQTWSWDRTWRTLKDLINL